MINTRAINIAISLC